MRRNPKAVIGVLLGLATLLGADIPRPEHPRPDAERPLWANLNGEWFFRFDAKEEGIKSDWQKPSNALFGQAIVVPFPWESELSRVHELNGPKVAWYFRSLDVPATFPKDNRVILHFGAVDYRADVWVNGQKVAEHEGGYSPFSADITDALKLNESRTLAVRVWDPTDPELPTGKQVGWYTPTSGIWQTVWLESRPASHISDFTIKTDLDSAAFDLVIVPKAKGEYVVSAKSEDGTFAIEAKLTVADDSGKPAQLILKAPVKNPKRWTPGTPILYNTTLTLKSPDGTTDTIKTYFGLRTIARGKYGSEPYERILLNGKPIYLRTALDQSFNPKGLYTAPDDNAFIRDMMLAKYVGLNGLRIHIKPDEPRRLYWADKLGLLILEDMPNTWRQTPRARKAWESTMREVMARDKNHPSIIAWIAFNETWGLGSPEAYKQDKDTQAWVKNMVGEIRKLDGTRLVEDNSPCNYDHVDGTDLNSWHFYIDDHKAARSHIEDVVRRTEPGSKFNYCPGEVQSTAPLINSEYGSISAGGGDRDVSWGFRDLTTQLRKHPKIQGYVYTELTDIEWEHNGFADYDRGMKQFGYEHFLPDMRPNELNGDDFVGYDAPPAIVGKPGEVVTIPVFISHFSDRPYDPKLRYWVDGVDENGDNAMIVMPKSIQAKWTPYGVTWQEPIKVKLPEHAFVGSLVLTLRDPQNQRFAANFVNLVVKETAVRAERSAEDDKDSYLRIKPEDFARARWSGGVVQRNSKVSGRGTGFFEYRIKVPPDLVKAGIESFFLRAELAARAGRDQVDWNSRVDSQDYPQTDERKAPTSFVVTMGSQTALADELEDDPADAQGVLSHLAGVDHGSYGYLVEAMIKPDAKLLEDLAAGKPLTVRIAVPDDAKYKGGLSVFGSDAGKYSFDPVLHVRTREVPPPDLGVDVTAPVAVETAYGRIKTVLVPGDSPGKQTVWSYKTDVTDPPAQWNEATFDDRAWKKGHGGFGAAGTPGIAVKTAWNTPTILMRTNVNLPKLKPTDLMNLHLFHDESVQVYVNGKRLLTEGGYVTSYRDFTLGPKQAALFQEGMNTIAVICTQTGGGQGIDIGLTIQPNEE